MKNFLKVFLFTALFILFSLHNWEQKVLAKDNFLTVAFKPGEGEKYIRILSLLTGTRIINKISDNVYNVKIIDDGKTETLKLYSELFSMIPEVTKVVTPEGNISQAKVKAGQIIPGVILVRFKKNFKTTDIIKLDKKFKTKTVILSSSLILYKVKLPTYLNVEKAIKLFKQEKIVEYAEADRIMTIQKNDNFINMNSQVNTPDLNLTFNPGSEEISVGLFNLVFDTNLIASKNSNFYLYKLPDNINPDTALQVLKLCPFIKNIKLTQRNK